MGIFDILGNLLEGGAGPPKSSRKVPVMELKFAAKGRQAECIALMIPVTDAHAKPETYYSMRHSLNRSPCHHRLSISRVSINN